MEQEDMPGDLKTAGIAINIRGLVFLKSEDTVRKLNAFGSQCAKHMWGITGLWT